MNGTVSLMEWEGEKFDPKVIDRNDIHSRNVYRFQMTGSTLLTFDRINECRIFDVSSEVLSFR